MEKKVLVFTIALEGYDALFESCIETQRAYCDRYGYQYLVLQKAPRSLLPTEAAWLKVPLLKSALDAGWEWVAFIDADCDMRKGAPPFAEQFESLGSKKSVFMAAGFTGRLNSGVVFVKNTATADGFFKIIMASADEKVSREDWAPYENGHFISIGKNSPDVHILDHSLWNNNSTLNNECYIQHYSAGMLRKWYMDHRAPAQYRKGASVQFRDLLPRLIRRMRTLIGLAPGPHRAVRPRGPEGCEGRSRRRAACPGRAPRGTAGLP
jgi:hypothetical protein